MLSRATPAQVNQAMQTIGIFEKDTATPQFTGLARASVAAGLRERVSHPEKLDQDQASLCGPAAFLYCLLNCHPEVFVQYVVDLYNTGKGRIGNLHIKPSKGCRHFRSDTSLIQDVDWVALASLRDDENIVMNYSSPKDTLSGATSPHILAKWFDKAGFRNVHNETNVFFSKGLPTLQRAAQKLPTQFVCLFINDNMLYVDKFKKGSHFVNHWVVLDGPLTSQADNDIQFSVYSWGDVRHVPVPGATGTMTRSDLSGNFYGYVSAMPT
jgi:hypothetical protein